MQNRFLKPQKPPEIKRVEKVATITVMAVAVAVAVVATMAV